MKNIPQYIAYTIVDGEKRYFLESLRTEEADVIYWINDMYDYQVEPVLVTIKPQKKS